MTLPNFVSPNDPCPFLRALVADGYIGDHLEPLSALTRTIATAARESPTRPQVSSIKVYLIALIANGLSPARLARSLREGVRLDELRSGPLDKRGVGSRILDVAGRIDERELERLDEFAVDKVDTSGAAERGLGAEQLRIMMDANFARSRGHRRKIDRVLMEGEWPVLLRVTGKASSDGPYLSLTDLRTLFVDRRLPPRVTERLEAPQRA
ncbi:MAG: hypothetical protein ACREM2_00590 [Vulcanimicrobiaceae bacterium]